MPTDRGCARIETVLDELFSNGAQVNDDLAGLYLMNLSSGLLRKKLESTKRSKHAPNEPRWPGSSP